MHEGHRKRLRAKYDKNPKSLTPQEVLEMFLFWVMPRKNTSDIACALFEKFGDSVNIFNATKNELMEVKGVGPRIATFIKQYYNAVNLKDYLIPKKIPVRLTNSKDSFEYLKQCFGDCSEEILCVLCLNENYKLIKELKYTNFNLHKIAIKANKICRDTLEINPTYVIIAHNHLFGDEYPSSYDDFATVELLHSFNAMGIELIDHVVWANEKIYSYRLHGHIDNIKRLCREETRNVIKGIKGEENE